MSSPFSPRAQKPRKTFAGLSMTGEQRDAFDALKERLGLPSDSAVLKAGLDLLYSQTFKEGMK